MFIDVLTGDPGCGKSSKMISEAAREAGRYIFAVPTIDLLEEQVAAFRHLCPSATCVPVHSRKRKLSVSRQIAELLDRSESHLVAFITHESLLSADLSGFNGWHVRIDEVPNVVSVGKINGAQSVEAFRTAFDLTPISGTDWSHLRAVNVSGSWKANERDSLWGKLSDFLKLAGRAEGVAFKARCWDDLMSGKDIPWLSTWSPSALSSMASVTIAGAGFMQSIAYRAMQATNANEVEFRAIKIGEPRTAQPPVRIMWFTQGHQGATTFWGKSEGRRCLVQIGDWLRDNAAMDFWSGNEPVRNSFEHRLAGEMVLPKLAGQNSLRDARACGIFYSSKALPQDAVLNDVFQISREDIQVAREDEDIFQFVMRGAIRNSDYRGAYNIYLYSQDQADRLALRLRECGLVDVETVPVPEAGVMDIARSPVTRKRELTPEEKEAKLIHHRAENTRRTQEWRAREKAKGNAANAGKGSFQQGRAKGITPAPERLPRKRQ